MKTCQFECTLITPNNEPLYKTYIGLGLTYAQLRDDIDANVLLMLELGLPLRHFDVPTIDDIMRCWVADEELVYTIECEDNQYNVEFRLTPKYN